MLVAIADASSDAIFAKDEAGRYLLFNNAAARFVGQPAEAVLGQDDRAIFPPDQAEQLMAWDSRLRSTGQAEVAEETVRTVDGDRVLLATKGPLRSADGRIFGTYGISRDITERKREEEAVQRLADDLSATLQAIPDVMFEFDAEGRYLKVKSMNVALLAAPAEHLLGRRVTDVLPAEAAATVMQALAVAGRAGSDFGRTMTLPLASGVSQFELSVARKPALAGQGERFVVLSRDITSRKAVELELRQRNQELERFNRAATEREVRMVALKREVNELSRAAGRRAPYDTSFADPPETPATP
jgi:PAS domain S-box-containing protein